MAEIDFTQNIDSSPLAGTPFNIAFGYISLPLQVPDGWPKVVRVEGGEFHLKSEFHVSLVWLYKIAPQLRPEQPQEVASEIVRAFADCHRITPLGNLEITGELYRVRDGAKQTLIVRCKIPGLADFFHKMNEQYKSDFPVQVTHITLYTLPGMPGIDIPSMKALAEMAEPIDVPEIKSLLTTIGLKA